MVDVVLQLTVDVAPPSVFESTPSPALAVEPTPVAPVTASASAQPAVTAAAPSTTTIKLAGKEIEMHGIPMEQAIAMYSQLPAEYQKRADAYTKIAKNVERVIKGLPEGMTLAKGWKAYEDAIKLGGDRAKHALAPLFNEFDAFVKEHNIPILGTVRSADRLADKADRFTDGVGAVFSDATGFIGNASNLFSVMGQELKGGVKGKLGISSISDEQAKAFGTVLAAAEFHESAVRQGLPLIDWSTNNVVAKYPGQAAGAAVDWAGSTSAWAFIKTCAKFVANLFSSYFGDDKNKYEGVDFGQRWAKVWEQSQAEANAEQAAKNPGLSYEERLTARVKAGETDRAAEKVTRAEVEKNFGMPEGTTGASAKGTPFVATNGTLNQVTADAAGTPEAKPVTTPKGTEIGRVDRVVQAVAAIVSETSAKVTSGDPVAVAGVAGGTVLASGTLLQGTRGIREGFASQQALTPLRMVDAAETAHDAAKARVATLTAKADALSSGKPSGLDAAKNFFRSDASAAKATAEKLAAIQKELVDAVKLEKAANLKADQLFAMAEKSTAASNPVAKAGLNKIEGGFWKTVTVDAPRHVSRWAGQAAGWAKGITDTLAGKEADALAKVAAHRAEVIKNAPAIATDVGKAAAASLVEPVGTMAKLGRAFTLYATPVLEPISLGLAVNSDDQRGIEQSKAAMYTFASGVAGTAAIVAVAGLGAIGSVAALPLVAVGAVLSGIAVLGSRYLAGRNYDARVETANASMTNATPAGALGTSDKGLAAAAVALEAANKQRLAAATAGSQQAVDDAKMVLTRMPFARATTAFGGVTPTANLPHAAVTFAELSS